MAPDGLSIMLKVPGPKLPSTLPLQLPTSDGSTTPSEGGAVGAVDERLPPQAPAIVARAMTMMRIERLFRLIAVSMCVPGTQVG